MKSVLTPAFILIFSLIIKYSDAQILECGTIMQNDSIVMNVNQNVTYESFSDVEPYVIKVHFWDINPLIGNNPHPLSELTALNAVAKLNNDFNSFNIFFKYDGIDVFASEFYETNLDPDESNDHANIASFFYDNNYFVQGAVNVYSLHEIRVDGPGGGASIEAAGVQMGGNEFFQITLMRHDYIEPSNHNASVITHEVGHFFNLRHTFHCRELGGTGVFICENVTRDINDTDCFNAFDEGDKIFDTNATPEGMQYDPINCTYDSQGEVDQCDIPYNNNGLEPEVKNFMSYTGTCKDHFSPGQIAWMRARILEVINIPNVFAIEIHPLSILYEQFDGEYYVVGPYIHNTPRFQKGFDYEFIDCSCNDTYNCDYPIDNVTGMEYNTNNVVMESYGINEIPSNHPNHTAIRILQVNENWSTKCYDNWNRGAIGGLVTKFNDNVFNNNFTQTPQDSTAINDQNLIENLDPGLYNVKKQFNDGTIEESNIFKENNE